MVDNSDYELFNCNKDEKLYESWYYRCCWHQTCPFVVFILLFIQNSGLVNP